MHLLLSLLSFGCYCCCLLCVCTYTRTRSRCKRTSIDEERRSYQKKKNAMTTGEVTGQTDVRTFRDSRTIAAN